MTIQIRMLLSASVMVAASAAAQAPAQRPEVALAAQQYKAGDAAACHATLAPLESSLAGQPEYDYLLGLCALGAGHAGEALFALRRAVVRQPEDAGMRVDLARAYFDVGDDASAKEEFDALLELNPPQKTRTVIDQYLRAIRRRSEHYRTRWTGFVGLGAGSDSNATSATDLSSFQGFDLDRESREAASAYGDFQGRTDYSRPLTARLRFTLDGAAGHREYPDASFVSRTEFGAGTGLALRREKTNLSARLGFAYVDLGSDDKNDSQLLDLGLRRTLGADLNFTASLRYARIRYDADVSARDSDDLLGALGLRKALSWGRGASIGFSLLAGASDAVEDTSPNSRSITGASLRLILLGRPGMQWLFGLSGVQSEFDGPFTEVGANTRDDTQLQAEVTLNLRNRNYPEWLLRASLRNIQNDSNIALYEYDRLEGGVQLRRLFE